MILGVDTGIATCGWAKLDEKTCSFVDLGVLIQPPIEGEKVTLDRIRRSCALGHVLARQAPGCDVVAVEALNLGMPGAIGKLMVGLAWGVVIGVVSMIDPSPSLMTIRPQTWQREVLPHAPKGKPIDYDELATAAGAYILRNHPRAAKKLEAIDPKHRNHAIDGAMIALCAALRPGRMDRVATRDGGGKAA